MVERRRLIRKRDDTIERRRLTHRVGYKKPPRHTRWAPGTSGNPRGRPKGKKNFGTELNEELEAPVVIIENGLRKTIKKRRAIAKQLVNKAVTGDHRALPTLLNEIRNLEAKLEASASSPAEPSPEDKSVMQGILRRIRKAAADSEREIDESASHRDDPENDEGDPS